MAEAECPWRRETRWCPRDSSGWCGQHNDNCHRGRSEQRGLMPAEVDEDTTTSHTQAGPMPIQEGLTSGAAFAPVFVAAPLPITQAPAVTPQPCRVASPSPPASVVWSVGPFRASLLPPAAAPQESQSAPAPFRLEPPSPTTLRALGLLPGVPAPIVGSPASTAHDHSVWKASVTACDPFMGYEEAGSPTQGSPTQGSSTQGSLPNVLPLDSDQFKSRHP
ncbi:predicted protein [Chaetomium globosum CBS 148.51]|uniref:Uncharacterized protein n=1 Tax=Chaetomium globosum (strain ATCC 6205 / CBS 148.51 / DSM 1962 / NBRC 6347 / NRRL 1970) TaxID=306901 RepID=Q2GPM3_CHAGB|nr:uncharacterized protein CHGG_10081 [Chaetomium globosum CBS 148.51]EAQ83677.1 predicted protein [Chaetomium globosum CBS 148.51]